LGNVILSLLLALLLNSKIKFRNLPRLLVFFPALISMTVVGLLWRYMYSSEYGVINYILLLLGVEPKGWLSSSSLALFSVIVTSIWYGLGWNTLIYLAGLQSIPEVYYEAAKIDGATSWSLFKNITLPLIRPVTTLIVVMATIYGFRTFDLIFVMTRGGPGRSTLLIMMHFYNVAFVNHRFGKASAIAFILFTVIMFLSILQLRIREKEKVTY